MLHRFPDEPQLNGFSWLSYRYFLDHNHVLSALIGTARDSNPCGSWFRLRTDGLEPERVDGVLVTGNVFSVLGVKPALGRLLSPEDDRIDAPAAVAVVSWPFWKNRYDLDRTILGRRIVADDVPVTMVGVAARGGDLALVDRLKPGVSIDEARAELAVRVSLGATRLRLVGQVTAESLLLSGAGALVGVVQAYFSAGVLVRQAKPGSDPVRARAWCGAVGFLGGAIGRRCPVHSLPVESPIRPGLRARLHSAGESGPLARRISAGAIGPAASGIARATGRVPGRIATQRWKDTSRVRENCATYFGELGCPEIVPERLIVTLLRIFCLVVRSAYPRDRRSHGSRGDAGQRDPVAAWAPARRAARASIRWKRCGTSSRRRHMMSLCDSS